jgi:methylase of polypeptide subunit release factors
MLHALLPSDRAWLITHDDEVLSEPAALTLHVPANAVYRASRWPTSWQQPFGLDLQVDKSVSYSRPDTETLVEWT